MVTPQPWSSASSCVGSLPVADHHAFRRSHASLRLHEAAAEAGLAPRVWYTSVEDRSPSLILWRLFPSDARSPCSISRRAAHPARASAVSRSGELSQHHVYVPDEQRACPGRIHPEVSGREHSRQRRNDELFARYAQVAAVYPLQFRPSRMTWCRVTTTCSSPTIFFSMDVALAGGLGSCFPERSLCRPGGSCEYDRDQWRGRKHLSEEYFGQPPGEYQLARFFLMQQVTHIFYAMGFMLLGSSGKPVDHREKTPDYQDFQRRFWAGEIRAVDKDSMVTYGRVHWERLRENLQKSRYDKSLKVISERSEAQKAG